MENEENENFDVLETVDGTFIDENVVLDSSVIPEIENAEEIKEDEKIENAEEGGL